MAATIKNQKDMMKQNKKGGVISAVIGIICLIIFVLAIYILYKNFHMTCLLSNLKSFTLNMKNCIR